MKYFTNMTSYKNIVGPSEEESCKEQKYFFSNPLHLVFSEMFYITQNTKFGEYAYQNLWNICRLQALSVLGKVHLVVKLYFWNLEERKDYSL